MSRPLAGIAALAVISVTTVITVSPIGAEMSVDPGVPMLLRGVHRIVTMGDSITEMGGQPGGYVSLMWNALAALYPDEKIEIINAGISGHKSTDMESRFRRDVIDKNPDLVTISVGVNDVWHGFYDNHPTGDGPRGIALPLYREKVEAMVDAAHGAKAKVVLVSPTLIYERLDGPENLKLNMYVNEMRSIARERGCGFVDLNAAFKEIVHAYQKRAGKTSNLLTTDGVHMNAAGNHVMAFEILRALGVPERSIANLSPKT